LKAAPKSRSSTQQQPKAAAEEVAYRVLTSSIVNSGYPNALYVACTYGRSAWCKAFCAAEEEEEEEEEEEVLLLPLLLLLL